jgi:hypothetical protein
VQLYLCSTYRPSRSGLQTLYMYFYISHVFTPSSDEIKNAWSYTSTPPYVFMVWCFSNYRNNAFIRSLYLWSNNNTVNLWSNNNTANLWSNNNTVRPAGPSRTHKRAPQGATLSHTIPVDILQHIRSILILYSQTNFPQIPAPLGFPTIMKESFTSPCMLQVLLISCVI